LIDQFSKSFYSELNRTRAAAPVAGKGSLNRGERFLWGESKISVAGKGSLNRGERFLWGESKI